MAAVQRKGLKMDKEMMAKIEEFVKEYSRRELNMEEIEQVVGGELGGLFLDGRYTPREDVYNMFLNMADIYGYNIAADVFCRMTGFATNEIAKAHRGGSSDKENMYTLITQCFTTFDKIQNGGKTF